MTELYFDADSRVGSFRVQHHALWVLMVVGSSIDQTLTIESFGSEADNTLLGSTFYLEGYGMYR